MNWKCSYPDLLRCVKVKSGDCLLSGLVQYGFQNPSRVSDLGGLEVEDDGLIIKMQSKHLAHQVPDHLGQYSPAKHLLVVKMLQSGVTVEGP